MLKLIKKRSKVHEKNIARESALKIHSQVRDNFWQLKAL